MRVDLYLKNINQEMIDAGRKIRRRAVTPGRAGAPGEWIVSWPKECCILDFSLIRTQEEVERPVTRGLMMRSEQEGGMFWNPQTGEVYKVDEEAYHAMLELDRGYSDLEVARRLNVAPKKITNLTRKLRKIQLES